MSDYALLDFGAGRKLERFGPYVLDRPAPAADGMAPAHPELWRTADARFLRNEAGGWHIPRPMPASWTVTLGGQVFEVRLTPLGQVGIFPEQAENWEWIARQVEAFAAPCRVLNLFAYTGGATLAAACAGAEVTHVDAAKNVVAWARQNAAHAGLAAAPIRWIVEDARKFVTRELRRGRFYEAVILDPPSYGHGPQGEAWKLAEHLPALLADCARLTAPRRRFVLLTCHTVGYGPPQLAAVMNRAGLASCAREIAARQLALTTAEGRTLASGAAACWSLASSHGFRADP